MLPESFLPLLLRRSFIQIVSGQDSSLVQALTASLQLQRKKDLPSEISMVLDIHCLLITFLRSVSFDYSVLLDLIISPETQFDSFLDQYLDLLGTGMPQLVTACKSCDALILDSESNTSPAHNISSSLHHHPPLPHKRDRAELEESQSRMPKASKHSDIQHDSTDSSSTEQGNPSPISPSDSGSDTSSEEEKETITSVTTLLASLSHSLAKLHTAEHHLLPPPKSNLAQVIHHKIESILLAQELT